ncbi:MAG TPA: hypothetical protein VHC45_13305 [Gaiellaceae bacterium]|nr:hypothetical protein [Gaiellaceae bacterium]
MRRLASLLALTAVAVLLAACGGSKHAAAPPATTTARPPSPADVLGPGGRALYQGGSWAVVQLGSKAAAVHYVGGAWQVDDRKLVQVEILGPTPNGKAARIPQVAAEMTGKTRLVEEGLWVDGVELLEKGGGTPTRVTAYGAPEQALKPGTHVAVAYARTATAGTAVAWTFTVG